MWQYSTETIINENVGNLFDKRFSVVTPKGVEVPVASIASAKAEDYFVIDGVNTLHISNIKGVYRTPYEAEAKEKIEIALNDASYGTVCPSGTVLRFEVKLREEGRVSSIVKNAYLRNQKPFRVEIASTGSATTDAPKLAAAMNKMLAMSDFDFFTVSSSVVAGSEKLIVEAADCYVRFVSAKVDKVPSTSTAKLGERLLGFEDFEDFKAWDKTTYVVKGKEGNGTVARLIKNLRIPTNASINPFAADQGGKPVPGGHYDQYLIEYVTDRYHVGGSVMGSVGDKSMTSHVFFVKNDGAVSGGKISTAAGASDDFEKIVNKIIALNGLTAAKAAENPSGSTNTSNVDTTKTPIELKAKTPVSKGSVE